MSKRSCAGILGALALVATAAVAADRAAGLKALDYGESGPARAALADEAAEASLWLAFAESGAAREAAARRAIELTSERTAWIGAAATALVDLAAGRNAEAVAAARQATALDPGQARLWKLLGEALEAQGDGAGARAAYEQAVALQPVYPAANVALGHLLREQNDFANAYNAFNHALDESEEPAAALVARAGASLYLGDEAGALADLAKAVEKSPPGSVRGSALLGILMVRAYQRQLPEDIDRADEAIRMWEELGRPDMVAASCNAVGRLMLETGYPEGSDGWYERGWQAIEGSDLAAEERTIWKVRELHGLARGAAARRELTPARQLAEEANQLMAADRANADHYAWIGPYLEAYLRLAERRWDDAISELQRSDLERPYLMMMLGEAHFRARNREQAREWYQRAFDASNGLDTESVIVRPQAAEWLARNR
ncbi:MAG TPA: tetratricopeptide repeat protein [Thermoanaerobaculia bacterium]|nr:tetratricopeptide repeat protein [Thermoanaerobaculia bacterium]